MAAVGHTPVFICAAVYEARLRGATVTVEDVELVIQSMSREEAKKCFGGCRYLDGKLVPEARMGEWITSPGTLSSAQPQLFDEWVAHSPE